MVLGTVATVNNFAQLRLTDVLAPSTLAQARMTNDARIDQLPHRSELLTGGTFGSMLMMQLP